MEHVGKASLLIPLDNLFGIVVDSFFASKVFSNHFSSDSKPFFLHHPDGLDNFICALPFLRFLLMTMNIVVSMHDIDFGGWLLAVAETCLTPTDPAKCVQVLLCSEKGFEPNSHCISGIFVPFSLQQVPQM